MAVSPLICEVSDLIIGKPPLRPLLINATIADALAAFRRCSGEPWLSVWSPDRWAPEKKTCVGKICIVDVVCYLCEEQNILRPEDALAAPVSNLLRHKVAGVVRRVETQFSVLEALDLILDGAQNLVVPLRPAAAARRKSHGGGGGAVAEFCMLTQEDLVRFFLNSISHFSPVPALSVAALGLVRADILAVRRRDPAISAVPLLRRALAEQTSVAVLSDDGVHLVGEISPSTIAAVCDESVAAAIASLSAGDLMSYVDCCPAPPEAAIRAVETKLTEKKLAGMLELLGEGQLWSTSMTSSSSSDEEVQTPLSRGKVRKQRSMGSYSARMSEEAIVCHPERSLVAIMVQALAHRVSYVWVVDEDYSPVGIVTFPDVLRVFRELLQ